MLDVHVVHVESARNAQTKRPLFLTLFRCSAPITVDCSRQLPTNVRRWNIENNGSFFRDFLCPASNFCVEIFRISGKMIHFLFGSFSLLLWTQCWHYILNILYHLLHHRRLTSEKNNRSGRCRFRIIIRGERAKMKIDCYAFSVGISLVRVVANSLRAHSIGMHELCSSIRTISMKYLSSDQSIPPLSLICRCCLSFLIPSPIGSVGRAASEREKAGNRDRVYLRKRQEGRAKKISFDCILHTFLLHLTFTFYSMQFEFGATL